MFDRIYFYVASIAVLIYSGFNSLLRAAEYFIYELLGDG